MFSLIFVKYNSSINFPFCLMNRKYTYKPCTYQCMAVLRLKTIIPNDNHSALVAMDTVTHA